MASISETGPQRNANNFETLISLCVGYGTTYNPSRAAIQISAMNTLLSNAQASLAAEIAAETALTTATNARKSAFDPLKNLCTKIVNALDATDASDKLVKDAKAINKKIQGTQTKDKSSPEPGGTTGTKTISTSRQSFDSIIENFDRLIQLVGSEPTYAPNESDLQTSTLTTLLGSLRTANTSAINAYTNDSNARITRKSIFDSPSNGMVAIAGDVKKYVKSVYGASSPQFKQISGLEFKKATK